MQTSICVEHITKKYGSHTVLNDISFSLNPGEFICLLGPSGCGKSTLLRMIAGLDTPTKGKVLLNNRDVTGLPPSKRNFGIVFQSYALFPNLTAFENVAYGLRNRKMRREQVEKIADHYLEMVGLSDAHRRYPAQLSGGEQQRVALARALTVEPDFLLLDEPLSALDAKVRIKLRREICRIQRELGLTTIMVTHDQEEAMTMADRIIVMNKAHLMQEGTPQEIYDKPNSRFVADFIGAINFFEKDGGLKAIRPEHIQLDTQSGTDSALATLTAIEFRGNFCRVSAKSGMREQDGELMVDVPAQKVRELNLKIGTPVYLNFPAPRVLHFAG